MIRDAFTHGPPIILRFRGPRAKFRKTSELQVPLQTYLATMSIKIHANRVLGTMHVTQNFLGVFQGAQIKSGPKAPTDLNAALWVIHNSSPWRQDKIFYCDIAVTPTLSTQPKLMKLSNAAMFRSCYLSLSHLCNVDGRFLMGHLMFWKF